MIKNYTSTVPIDRTISRIEQALVKAGVVSINKEYGPQGELIALLFKVQVLNQQTQTAIPLSVRLPANVNAVYETMKRQVKRWRSGQNDRLKEQTERTAWKLMQDWVEVQLSQIQMRQVEVLQVFLPYVWDDRQKITYYDSLKAAGFKALPERVE